MISDMGAIKRKLQYRFELENKQPAEPAKPDPFYCGVDKFKKMLKQVALMRKLQNKYFETRDKEVLKKARAIETKTDKAIAFYAENEERLHDCPFT